VLHLVESLAVSGISAIRRQSLTYQGSDLGVCSMPLAEAVRVQ